MKTIKVRPVLIESKEPTNIVLKPNGELAHSSNIPMYGIGQLHWKSQQLILISLEPDEEIRVGDLHFFESEIQSTTNRTIEYLNNSGDNSLKKVIALQPQIPESYIQQFIEEYNKGEVKDIEIEMEDNKLDLEESVQNIEEICLEEHDNVEDSPYYEQYCLAIKDMDNIVYKPKLTNGFVTIVNNLSDINLKDASLKDINDRMNPNTILYTLQEVSDLFEDTYDAYYNYLLNNGKSSSKESSNYFSFKNWFEQNEKK